MDFVLTYSLSTVSVDERDVHALKSALNRLGLYTPDPDIGITGMTDNALFSALKQFQTDKKMPVTGSIRPRDDTVVAINRAIEDQPISQKYVWRTVGDDKVRGSHAAREGKVFSWLDHPIPGEDFNCRCWAEPVTGKKTVDQIYDPPIEPVQLENYSNVASNLSKIIIGYAVKKYGTELVKRTMFTTVKQLTKKFKHANDFGIKGNPTAENLDKFRQALDAHIKSPDTKIIEGIYRGKEATHFYNSKTGLNVIRNSKGDFWSSWKLPKDRAKILLQKGKL